MKVYTLQEIAAMMRVSDRTIEREIARKRLEVFRVGKQVRISQSQVDKMMRQQTPATNTKRQRK